MNVVILHCHFERGGVTQVVENHVAHLTADSQVDRVVLVSAPRISGLSSATRQSAEQLAVADLDYDSLPPQPGKNPPSENQQRARVITECLQDKLRVAGLIADQTVLHWHNHSLGKNVAIPLVIRRLADLGWKQLLQIHDFAEDNRPDNYGRLLSASGATTKSAIDEYLYPSHDNIRFAALTQGDVSVLQQLGRPADLLFNSVELSIDQLPSHEEALGKVRSVFCLSEGTRYTLYPVRGIRRKNVGEWLLLTRMLPENTVSGITLQPATPVERASYARWRSVATELAPRAVFDVGHHPEISFLDNLAASDKVLSPSVAEGFGMTFLEPWLVGREVVARRLPGVADDFAQAGVELSKLYESIPIPGSKQWVAQCWAETNAARDDANDQLPAEFRPPHEELADQAETIDFAKLTPARQIEVLRRVAKDVGFEREIMERSGSLINGLATPACAEQIANNKKAIHSYYSVAGVGQRLIKIYQQTLLAQGSPDAAPPAGFAAEWVNQNRSFFPCRTETFADVKG